MDTFPLLDVIEATTKKYFLVQKKRNVCFGTLHDASTLRSLLLVQHTDTRNDSCSYLSKTVYIYILCRYVSGEITIGEVNSVLPFLNTNDVVELEGKYLLEALEHSVSNYDPIALPGRFLQFSGKCGCNSTMSSQSRNHEGCETRRCKDITEQTLKEAIERTTPT